MERNYWKGIIMAALLITLTMPLGSAEILCSNNSTSVISIAEICINLTNEPCISCDVNFTIFNPISSTPTLTINYTTLMNESGRGWYNVSFLNPKNLGRYPLFFTCNDSGNVYGDYDYNFLEIREYCEGEGIAEIKSSLELNWTQLWNYFNCTNATSDLNDICRHLDTIIADVGDVEGVVIEVEDDVDDLKKDLRTVKINTKPTELERRGAEITGRVIGFWDAYGTYIIIVIIILVIIIAVLAVRWASNKNVEYKKEEEGIGPEEEGF